MNWLSGLLSLFAANMSWRAGALEQEANEIAAEQAEINARKSRQEAEAEAERYAASSVSFKAEQKVKFLKGGVTLEGSPLAILDETVRVASENISAIKAKGEASAQSYLSQAEQLRASGRAALLGGRMQGVGYLLGAVDRLGLLQRQPNVSLNPNIPSRPPSPGSQGTSIRDTTGFRQVRGA